MQPYNWENEEDEYISDTITLIILMMEDTPTNEKLTEKGKQNFIDNCLDKLNSLYDEQRKRGTFKSNSGRT
jgi:ribosome assembly protein YihI (activator of Der GTPase)